MAAIVVLKALDQRGEDILDEMESVTDTGSERLDHGKRRYSLLASYAHRDAFDAILNEIAPGWTDHVANLTPR